MFSVNRMPNGQRPYISNKEQNNRVAVAFFIAITIVIIVSSLLFAGLMLSYGKGSTDREVDNESPVIICPNDINRTIPLNIDGANITWSPPQISDNSEQVSITSTHISGDNFFLPDTTVVTNTAQGPSGNTAECSFRIKVIKDNKCDEEAKRKYNTKCEFPNKFTYFVSGIPSSCHTVPGQCDMTAQGFPAATGQSLGNCIGILFPGYSFTYTYAGGGPSQAVSHVLVNSCHGCLCLKIEVRICLRMISGGGDVGGASSDCDQSVAPTGEIDEGDQVTVEVTKTGTDASNVDIEIIGESATAGVDYQIIAPFTLNFNDLGDQVISFTIDTVNDDVDEQLMETFKVQLSNPWSGEYPILIEYPILTITIIDND